MSATHKQAWRDARLAIGRLQVDDDLRIDVVAVEPLLQNPVALAIDGRGRFFVAETHRIGAGIVEISDFPQFLTDDLSCRTVSDRQRLLRKIFGDRIAQLCRRSERIRRLEDRDGDGRLDTASTLADGFRAIEAGIGADVALVDKELFYACVPALWALRDADDDGRAERRRTVLEGFGVHIGSLGHDLHGLLWAPDGRLYFTMGDRGLHLPGGKQSDVACPDTGAVLRCWPDGSELEIVAVGLRNPQDLAMDAFGNLFTVDNNADNGDRSRLLYIVEGADFGWRLGYQTACEPLGCGAWNAERLWDVNRWHAESSATAPAYVLPPVANIADGPAGLAYYPGTGLPPRFAENFLLADFRGTPARSGVRRFRLSPRGAGFALREQERVVWGVLATDVAFGPKPGFYVTDWGTGWDPVGKGRIFHVAARRRPPTNSDSKPGLPVASQCLSHPMSSCASEQLAALLGHEDMRVRLAAQRELATRSGTEAIDIARRILGDTDNRFARLHATWLLGSVARRYADALAVVAECLEDEDAEIRAQAARLLGDHRYRAAVPQLVERLTDSAPRVRLCAALAIARIGDDRAATDVRLLLRENDDQDPWLRHAGVVALAATHHEEELAALATDPSPAIRRAAVLALRRLRSPKVARFLNDDDRQIVFEAARAIYDVPISGAMKSLAALLDARQAIERFAIRATSTHLSHRSEPKVPSELDDRLNRWVSMLLDSAKPRSEHRYHHSVNQNSSVARDNTAETVEAIREIASLLGSGARLPANVLATAQAVEADPHDMAMRRRLAWMLAAYPQEAQRRPSVAVALISTNLRLSNSVQPEDLEVLAAALAARGEFDRAVAEARKARRMLARRKDAADRLFELERRIMLYRAHEAPGDATLITPEPVRLFWRRVIGANFLTASPEAASRLVQRAVDLKLDATLRSEMLRVLREWLTPPPIDPFLGRLNAVLPGNKPSRTDVARLLHPAVIDRLLRDINVAVRLEAVHLVSDYRLGEAAERLSEMVARSDERSEVRVAALDALARLDLPKPDTLDVALKAAVMSRDALLRSAARRLQARAAPEKAVPTLAAALEHGSLIEQQAALATLAELQTEDAARLLAAWLQQLLEGRLAEPLRLDVLEAARAQKTSTAIERLLQRYEQRISNSDDPLAAFRVCLLGGNARRGRDVFLRHAQVRCVRCHRVDGYGGDVGPPLDGVGQKRSREFLLESLVAPSRRISEGYETLVVELTDGRTLTGIVRHRDAEGLTLVDGGGRAIRVAYDKIAQQRSGPSAMPHDVPKHLSLFQLRDLIAYLASLR